jgi:hypothetical protein
MMNDHHYRAGVTLQDLGFILLCPSGGEMLGIAKTYTPFAPVSIGEKGHDF